jgi:hypothetical protein
MLRKNVRLQYWFRITDGNQAEVCGELPHRKGLRLPAIAADPAGVYHEDEFDENRVKY